MIAGGLLWVFAAMFVIALLGILVSLMMSKKTCDHAVSKTEALEALAG
jgi:hypothetical protein